MSDNNNETAMAADAKNADGFIEKMMRNERRELADKRVTAWLEPGWGCGETSYAGVRTNAGWCAAEVKRLAAHGVRAATVYYCGLCAVYRLGENEGAEDIVRMLEKHGVKIDADAAKEAAE